MLKNQAQKEVKYQEAHAPSILDDILQQTENKATLDQVLNSLPTRRTVFDTAMEWILYEMDVPEDTFRNALDRVKKGGYLTFQEDEELYSYVLRYKDKMGFGFDPCEIPDSITITLNICGICHKPIGNRSWNECPCYSRK